MDNMWLQTHTDWSEQSSVEPCMDLSAPTALKHNNLITSTGSRTIDSVQDDAGDEAPAVVQLNNNLLGSIFSTSTP